MMEAARIPGGGSRGLLAPEGGRGGLLAAAGILLVAALTMITIRLADQWSDEAHFALAFAIFLVVFGLGALGPPADERPPAYQSVLLLAGLAALLFALPRLAQVIGVDDASNSGTVVWMSAIFTSVAGMASVRYGSAACALLAALGLGTFVLSAIDWIFDPSGLTTARWILTGLAVAFALLALAMRTIRGPLHAAQFVNAAGLTLISLSVTFFGGGLGQALGGDTGSASAPGFGWKLVLILGSLAVIAYAMIDRARGPGYVGAFALFISVALVAIPETEGEGTLVGWPLVLLILAALALALGLRPRRDGGPHAPGAPPPGGGEPPTLVARPDGPGPVGPATAERPPEAP
ncbi:MAG TPA: hypothetical protein VF545_03715 [Thermoleophilaceae bacterium]